MSKFLKGQSSKKSQVWLQRLVKFWLASGMIAMPWVVQAAPVAATNIVRTDGATGDTVAGNVRTVYAGKDMGSGVGASTFSQFDVKQGDVANMQFRTAASAAAFNTLLNFVEQRINVDGTVNAIHNSKIGGHLFFLSPAGMAVGVNGAINAGSLTVLTPTSKWWKDRSVDLDNNLTQFDISKLTNNDITAINSLTIPINSTGTIAVQGKINTINDIRLKAGKINIGADADDKNKTAASLLSGKVNFSDVVNLTPQQITDLGLTVDNLTAYRDSNGGDIIIAAEVSVNENDCAAQGITGKLIDKQSATAEINVVGGSSINAVRNVNMTATAVNNVELGEYVTKDGTAWTYIVNGKEITEAEFKSQYQRTDEAATAESPAKLAMYGSTTKIYAKINVEDEGTNITGENVDINATAKNVYQNCSDVSYVDQKKIDDLNEEYFKKTNTDFWFSYLMNGMDVVYADMTTEATVTIGQDTVVLAKAKDREETVVGSGTVTIPALRINAVATTEIELGTQTLSLNAANTQTIPGIGFIWGMINNSSNITIAGTLKSDKGSTEIKSIANASTKEHADTGYGSDSRAFTSDAGFNFGVVVFVGDNEANLDIKDTAKMTDLYGNITLGASAVNNLDLNNDLKTSDKAATAFGISWMDFDAKANVNIAAPVESKNGNIITFAESTIPVNNFVTYAEAGDAGFFSGYTKIQRQTDEANIRQKLDNKLNTILSSSSSGSGGSGSNNLSQTIQKIQSAFQTSDAFMKSMNEKMKMGISLGVAKQTNVAKVNIASTGSLKAKGDIKITAKAELQDLKFQVYGASSNAQIETSGGQAGKDLMANGAILVSSVENSADITIENGNRGEKNALDAGGTITLRTDALMPYNRINRMVDAINKYVAVITNSFNNMKTDTTSYSANDIAAMEAALADFTKKATALQAELYDDEGNLKPEYADSSDGYSALIEQINTFLEDPTMQNFTEFMQGKEYTYTDSEGQQHTIKFDNKTGSGGDAGSSSLKDTLKKVVDDLMLAAGGIKGLLGAALEFAEPANYLNYYVGSATKGNKNRDLTSNVAVAIDLGITSSWNKSRVIIGSDAEIVGVGNVTIDANTKADDVSLTGKIGTTGGGKKASVGCGIGLAEVNNLSMVTLADNVQLGGADIELNAKNYTNHIAIGELLNIGSGNEAVAVNGIAMYVGGESDSIISIDDEADITATGAISLKGENTINGIMVAGGLAIGAKGTESLTFGMMSFNRNNYVTVGDNDAGNLSDAAIEADDTEEERLKKLIAKQSGMNSTDRAKYFGSTSVTNTGEIKGISLTDKALSDGDMVNVVMDVGYGSDTASDTATSVGTKISNAATSALNWVGSWSTNLGTKCTNMSNAISKMVPGGNAGNIPKTSFSGTGSVAINDIDSHTLAMVDGTNITLVEDSTTAKVDVYSEDTSTIVSVAGGVSYSNKKGGRGTTGSKTGIAMAAGAAVNLVDNYTISQISNSKIEKAKSISNKAVREGLLVAVGAGVDVTRSEAQQGTGATVGGATSINIATYGTKAIMKNDTVNDSFTGYKTDLTNEAQNQDAQGSGCLNLNLPIGGKTGVSVGGVIAYDEINNDVEANMIGGGTYKNMGTVGNIARADLTQIQAALGMGVSTSSTSVTLEGSAAVGIFRNKMKANVEGITLVGDAFTSKAFDENFTDANSHIAVANSQGFDMTGQNYVDAAKDEALKDGETLRQSGNTLVNVAVQVGAAAGKQGTNVAVGASVGVVESDNEYIASMNNSDITVTNLSTLAESSTLEVGVAAGGNGSSKGFAGGGAVAVTLMNDKVIDEIKSSDITADVLTLQALNKNELVNVTGEVAVGADKKASAVGLDVTYNYLGTVTKTLLENTDVKGRTDGTGAAVTMLSKNDADYYSVAVGVAVAGGSVAVNGSVSVNQGRNDTYAMAISDASNTLSLSSFDISTYDDSYYCAGAGGLGLTYGKSSIVAVGGAVAYNQLGVALNTSGGVETSGNTQQNIAEVSGYNIKLTGDMDVHAYDMGKMLTVGVGVGLGGKVAVQGASADTFLYKNTKAGVYDTNVNKDDADAQGNVDVYAETSNKTESIAVVVSGTTGYAAVGAGVNVVTMKGDTSATLAGGTYKVDDVLVKAKSYQKLLSNVVGVAACVSGDVTIPIGGSVTVSNLNNNTYATLGYSNSEIDGGKGVTQIDADGNVGVLAQSDEDFENYTGQATVSVSKMVAVGAGAAVAVNQTSGDTIAKAQNAVINTSVSTDKNVTLRNSIAGGNEVYKGLVVDADAYHKFYDAPWCGGLTASKVVSVAADATVGVDEMGGSTKAEVYSVSFNKNKTNSVESNNDFVVQATDKVNAEPVITNAVVSIAAAGAISVSANVGAGVGTFKNERIVESAVTGDKTRERYILNADKVKVNADSELDFKAVNTAVSVVVSVGEGSISGTVGTGVLYVDLDSQVKATMKGVESTNNGISLTSNQDTDFNIVGTSVAVAVSASLYGASLSVGVHVDTIENNSKTITLLEDSNIYHYEDNTAEDVISAKSNYVSHNQDCNVSASASIASGAVGVLVVDNELNNVVTTDVKNSTIGTSNKQAKNIDVITLNTIKTDFDNQNVGAAVGLSVGVGVGLSTVDASVASNITSSTLYARNDIDVKAEQQITMLGEMVTVPVGCLSVGVSTLHNYVGTAVVDDQYEDWEEESVSASDIKKNDFSSKNIDDLVVEVTKQGDDILTSVEKSYKSYGEEPISMESMQKIARSTAINSEGTKVNLTNAKLFAGNDINGSSKEVVNSNPTITAVGVGAIAVNVETNRVRVKDNVGVNVTGGHFLAGNNINLNTFTDGEVKTDTLEVGVGGVAVGVTIGEITKDGKMDITLNTADMFAGNNINVLSKDSMKIYNYGQGVNVGGVAATAVDYTARDNSTNTITLQYDSATGRGNDLYADGIYINAYSTPSVKSYFKADTVSLVAGCGIVMESSVNTKTILDVQDMNTLLADVVTLESGVYKENGYDTLSSDVMGVSVGGVAVHVNKSRTYSNVTVGTNVGALTLMTEEGKDKKGNTVKIGKSVVSISAFDATETYNKVYGVIVGAAASGSNYSQSKFKSNVTTTVNAGNNGLYADSLTIVANGKDTVSAKANGDGGGAVDISPEAAKVETEVDSTTITSISGVFNVQNRLQVEAVRTDDLMLKAEATQAEMAGGSGTKVEINHINETTTVNVSDANIVSYGKLDIASTNNIYINKDNSSAVDGNGYGGIDVAVADVKSKITLNSVVNIDSTKIHGYDLVNISANTVGYITLDNSVFSLGLSMSYPCGKTDSNIAINNKVNIRDSRNKGTEIRTETVDKDLTIAAAEDIRVYVRSYTEAALGMVGVVVPEAYSTIVRNNSINLEKGTIYSTRDINLYSGKKVDGSLGYMNMKVESEALNNNLTSIIPCIVFLSNKIEQNNNVTIGGAGNVRSIRHTNIYADRGHESIYEVAQYHSGYGYTDDQGTNYVSTSSGDVDSKVTRNNNVVVNGNVVAGLASALNINIGTENGEFVIVGDQERSMVQAANPGRTVYSGSDADKAKFITFGDENSRAAAESIGLTIDDFIVGRQSYSQAVGDRLNEVNALLADYAKDADKEVYNGLKAEQQRLQSIMASLNAGGSSGGTVTPDMIDYILIPDLVASGGNVVINTKNFNGTGKVEAKGNPDLTINNYTNLMLITSAITVDDPGGVIYYNNVALDPSLSESMQNQVKKLNASSDAVKLNLVAAKGTDASVHVMGLYNSGNINYGSGAYYYADNSGNKVVYDPNDAVLVTFYGSTNGLYHETTITTDEKEQENYNYYIDVKSSWESEVASGKYYFTKDKGNAVYSGTRSVTLSYKETETGEEKSMEKITGLDGRNYYYIDTSDGRYYLAKTSVQASERVHYQSGQLKYDNGKFIPYDTAKGNQYYDVIAPGNYRPKADIQIAGNISSLNGLAHIESKNNSITVGGKSVTDDISIKALTVVMKADNGGITQNYTDGTVNIGGEVTSQYKTLYDAFVTTNKNKTEKMTDDTKALILTDPSSTGGSWIAGGQVYIAANDININGVIQSGYDKYYAEITADDQTTIVNIRVSWKVHGKPQLSDTAVLNSGSTYLVKGGNAVWNSERKCYEYNVGVYYNPSTNQLVTANINSTGGRIYLTGRIASTGSGNVICLDGAYNITIKNNLNYDLRLGELVVNDTKGLVSVTDPSYYVTHGTEKFTVTADITTSGTKYSYYDSIDKKSYNSIDNPGKFTGINYVTGSNRSYSYAPKSGLRYNWVSGYGITTYTEYTTEEMAYWWGLDDYDPTGKQQVLDQWIEEGNCKVVKSGSGEEVDRNDGAYLSTGGSSADVYFMHTGETTSSKTYESAPVREWSSGFFGCHKYREYTYTREQGQIFTDYASIKADNAINITMIGVAAADSQVKVDTTQDMYFGQNIGNSALYYDDGKHVEKGTVDLKSNNGSIIQQGGNITGATVKLSAKNDMQNIHIIAGESVNLTGLLNGTGKANIVVDKAYGGGVGNVILNNLGGANAAVVDLTAAGSIIQNTTSDLVQAKRINLTAGGSVTGQNGDALYLVGGQDVDADSQDTLRASVNIDAQDSVIINQKSGDLRIGTIYSTKGDVTITVPEGSIRDALPYVADDSQQTEAELLAKWEKDGLIDGDDDPTTRSEKQISRDAILASGAEAKDTYVANINKQFDKYLELKADIAAGKTLSTSDQKIYNIYNSKFAGYSTAADYLAQDSTAVAMQEKLQNNVNEIERVYETSNPGEYKYTGWNKYQLLYAVQDSVINQHAGVKSSNKAPNIYANNVNLTVKNDVGLNSPNVTTFDLTTLDTTTEDGLKKLQLLSRADAATVTWENKEIDGKTHKIVTIEEKIAIGLHNNKNDGSGKINVTTTDTVEANTKNVFLEVRKGENLVDNLSIIIGEITTANGAGDVRISSLKDILTSNASSVLSARDVVLLAGEVGTNNGNIGSSTDYFDLDMSGKLTATATGNIYLNQSSKDWYITAMSAGKAGNAASTDSGNIYLTSSGNIYGVYDDALAGQVQGYIQTDSSGVISISTTAGNIGSFVTETIGVKEVETKILRVKNNAGSVLLAASGDIVLEGVSTNIAAGNTPAGTLNVTSVASGTNKLKLTVNGELVLGDTIFTDAGELDGEMILSAATLSLNSMYEANEISVSGTLGIKQKSGIIKANTISAEVGKILELTCGVMNVGADKLKQAGIVQVYNNDNITSSTPKIIANDLTVKSYGFVDLGSKENQLGASHFDVATGAKLGMGIPLEDIFASVTTMNADFTNTHDNKDCTVSHYNPVGTEISRTFTNTICGDIEVKVYDDGTNRGALTITDGLTVNGSLALYNDAGDLTLQKKAIDGHDIYVGGTADYETQKGSVTNSLTIYAKNNVFIKASGKDIDSANMGKVTNSGNIYIGYEGLVIDGDNAVTNNGDIASLHGGQVMMTSDTSLTNSRKIYAVGGGDVTLFSIGEVFNDSTGDIFTFSRGQGLGTLSMISSEGNVKNTGKFTISQSLVKEFSEITKPALEGVDIVDGNILFSAKKGSIINNKGLLAQGNITLESKTSITNNVEIIGASETTFAGIGMRSLEGKILLTSLGKDADDGKISNNVGLKADKGSIIMYAENTIDNVSNMYAGKGNVILRAKGNLNNTGSIIAKKDHSVIEKQDTSGIEVQDWYEWIKEHGNAGGWVSLISLTGDINNEDIYNFNEGNIAAPGSFDYAESSMMFVALQGSIYSTPYLIANNNVVLASKVAITSTKPGDIVSREKGHVYLYTYGTNVDGTIINEKKITTNEGNIYMVSKGSKSYEYTSKDTGVTISAPVSIYNDKTGDIIARGGNVVINGERGVANRGDIYASKNTVKENGNVRVSSNHGGVMIFEEIHTDFIDDPLHIERSKYKKGDLNVNIFAAEGKIDISAPYGILYNEKDLVAGDDVSLLYGGGGVGVSITVNNNITSQNGKVDLRTNDVGTKLIVASTVTAGQSAFVNSAGDVIVSGTVTAQNDSVNISAKNRAIVNGTITAMDGVAAVGTEAGDLLVTGTVSGDKVVLYTEDVDANITFKDIVVNDELILAGNHWNEKNNGVLDMSKVLTDSDNYVLKLYGAGKTTGGGSYKLDYGDSSKTVYVEDANVEKLEIVSQGPVMLEHVNVSDRADIYSQGTKSSVYGRAQAYDGMSNTIYYAPGNASVGAIDLHDMYFDGNSSQYQKQMDRLKEDSNQFADGNGTMNKPANGRGGMSLYVYQPHVQEGNGILLKNYYGQKTFRQRFSAENHTQHLNSEKAQDFYNGYFNIGVEFFASYNLLDIPSADLNQGHGQRTSNVIQLETMFEDGGVVVEGTITDKNGKKIKKTVEYEF